MPTYTVTTGLLGSSTSTPSVPAMASALAPAVQQSAMHGQERLLLYNACTYAAFKPLTWLQIEATANQVPSILCGQHQRVSWADLASPCGQTINSRQQTRTESDLLRRLSLENKATHCCCALCSSSLEFDACIPGVLASSLATGFDTPEDGVQGRLLSPLALSLLSLPSLLDSLLSFRLPLCVGIAGNASPALNDPLCFRAPVNIRLCLCLRGDQSRGPLI